MSTKPNPRRGTKRIPDSGPTWENHMRPGFKPDAPSVARARKGYRTRARRKERRTGKPVDIIVPGRQRRRPRPLPTE
jgi:hypothetical protein